MSRQLDDLERRDPSVRAARERLDEVTRQILGKRTARMRTFKKRPVLVQAVQFDGSNAAEVASKFPGGGVAVGTYPGHEGGLMVCTDEGTMAASPGDWIIRGIKGEVYPCKPDVFEASYEEVHDAQMRSPQEADEALRQHALRGTE